MESQKSKVKLAERSLQEEMGEISWVSSRHQRMGKRDWNHHIPVLDGLGLISTDIGPGPKHEPVGTEESYSKLVPVANYANEKLLPQLLAGKKRSESAASSSNETYKARTNKTRTVTFKDSRVRDIYADGEDESRTEKTLWI